MVRRSKGCLWGRPPAHALQDPEAMGITVGRVGRVIDPVARQHHSTNR